MNAAEEDNGSTGMRQSPIYPRFRGAPPPDDDDDAVAAGSRFCFALFNISFRSLSICSAMMDSFLVRSSIVFMS